MSSSEDDVIAQPVKYVKRRKRFCANEHAFKQVNLFSRKVMPTLQINQSILNKVEQELQKESVPNSKASVIYLNESVESNQSHISDDDVQIVDETSPVKPIPLTPPPKLDSPDKLSTKQNLIQQKRKKLLCNVASVVLNAKQDEQLSIFAENDLLNESLNNCDEFTVVKIRFHSQIYKYPQSKNSTFKDIFFQLSKDTMCDKSRLLLTLKDQQIRYDDTPESIGLSVVDFIDAVIMDDEVLRKSGTEANRIDCINIHFQCKFQKTKKTYSVNKYTSLIGVMRQYAADIQHDMKNLYFLFDGDKIDGSLSAQDLEIEDDYCLDVMRISGK